MRNAQREQIAANAVRHYGEEHQKNMAVEECAELINALQKEKRGRNGRADVITEIADVFIMCKQLERIYGYADVEIEIDRKLERLQNRINNDYEKI